jgi:glycosyltransferase involved in cell wall biosynthesis
VPVRTVAHFLPWPGIGGTEHATLRIARAVRERGFRNVAFCLHDAEEVHQLFRDDDIPTVPYVAAEPSLRHPAPYLRNQRALARELSRMQVDLLHCADVMGGLQAGPAGRLARVPVLCHVRNPWPELSRRERVLLAAVNTFVFVSRDTWAQFAATVPPSRGRVLYDGILADDSAGDDVGSEVRRELGIAASTRVVGMTARVAPQKDYFTLGKAAARVLETIPDVRFVVVGDYAGDAVYQRHYDLVREELRRLGVLDAFLFTGFRSDVARVMRAFDVFVLSTHFEGLPLVVLEAMAVGLPVIATAVNGIPEVIDRDEVGMLFPHEDDARLATHLIATLSDDARARRIGAAGRESVRRNFSPQAFADNVVKIYDEALRTRS